MFWVTYKKRLQINGLYFNYVAFGFFLVGGYLDKGVDGPM